MENTIANARLFGAAQKRAYSYKYVACMCALLFALILGRSVSDSLFYAFAGVSFLVFAMSSIQHCIPMLLFLLPFSTILKPDLDSISIFTVLSLLVVLKMVLSNKKVDVWLFVWLLLFTAYGLVFSGISELTTIITIVSGILMLYYVRYEDVDVDSAVMFFSLGICLASMLAMVKSYLPIVHSFVTDTVLKLGQDSYATRFSGLQGNPNYYTLDIIVALAAIIVLMYNHKTKKQHLLFIVALTVFGLMSVSKSFLVSLILLTALWFFVSVKQGVGKLGKFILIIAIGVAAAYYFAYDYINSYMMRFLEDESGTVGSVTTGRTELWLAYFDAIINDLKTFLFGNGLRTTLEAVEKGAHNTYLESLFNLGIVGSGLLFAAINRAMGKFSMKGALWILPVVLMVRMFAIGILTYDNLWFYLLILVMLSRLQHTNANVSTD